MNDRDRVRYEACKRSAQIGHDYTSLIPAGSIFEQKFADIDTKVNEFEASAGLHDAAVGIAAQQFDLKDISREDLNDMLTAVANAARAAEPDHVGMQARYRFDRNLNDADLLAAGNNFLTADAGDQALLILWGAPATWHADLTALVAGFDASFSSAASAQDSKVGLTAEQRALLNQAMQIKRTLGHMISNYFGSSTKAMAAWHAAAHVEVLNSTPPPPGP